MTPEQIAVFMEERKWDYRGEIRIRVLGDKERSLTKPQPSVSQRPFLRVFQLLVWFSWSLTVLEQQCGLTVRVPIQAR